MVNVAQDAPLLGFRAPDAVNDLEHLRREIWKIDLIRSGEKKHGTWRKELPEERSSVRKPDLPPCNVMETGMMRETKVQISRAQRSLIGLRGGLKASLNF
jgi:hypothetical protein